MTKPLYYCCNKNNEDDNNGTNKNNRNFSNFLRNNQTKPVDERKINTVNVYKKTETITAVDNDYDAIQNRDRHCQINKTTKNKQKQTKSLTKR